MIAATYAMTPGSWVVNTEYQRIAKVKDVYVSEPLLDLVFFARDGARIGRESPAMGGPRGFEPACAAENWIPIERPLFPLPRYGSLEGRVRLSAATVNGAA